MYPPTHKLHTYICTYVCTYIHIHNIIHLYLSYAISKVFKYFTYNHVLTVLYVLAAPSTFLIHNIIHLRILILHTYVCTFEGTPVCIITFLLYCTSLLLLQLSSPGAEETQEGSGSQSGPLDQHHTCGFLCLPRELLQLPQVRVVPLLCLHH